MQYPERGTIGYGQINALSWRVASELSRRDSSLFVGLAGEGSALHADSLLFLDGKGLEYQARRRGLGFAAFRNGRHGEVKWDRAFRMRTARQIATALETSVGIHLPDRAPKTTRRALSYRVLASVLRITLADSGSWNVVPGKAAPLEPELVGKGNARLPELDYCRWDLCRDENVVAAVDIYGYAQVKGNLVDLYKRYDETGRRITPLTADVFGGIMP